MKDYTVLCVFYRFLELYFGCDLEILECRCGILERRLVKRCVAVNHDIIL